MPFTEADLKAVMPVAKHLECLLKDPEAAGETVRHETQHLQIVIEFGHEAYYIDEREGSPYVPDGFESRCRHVGHYGAKKIDAPELAPGIRRVLDDLLAIDTWHLEAGRRRERNEAIGLLEDLQRLADVRPDTPNADYCVLEGAIRWKKTLRAPTRLRVLLAQLLDSPRPVAIGVVRGNRSTKTLQNEVSSLRKLLVRVDFPKQIKWKNDLLSLV